MHSGDDYSTIFSRDRIPELLAVSSVNKTYNLGDKDAQKTDITYDNVDVIKASYSDACGFTRLNLNNNTTPSFPTTITFNGSSDTLGSIPIVTEKNPYKCVNGVAQWKSTAQTSVFQTSVTNNSLITKNIYISTLPNWWSIKARIDILYR
jgi:hypothetical protein